MKKNARKVHITLGVICAIPVLLTLITGMGAVISEDYFGNEKFADFLISIHTMEIFGLQKIYPLFVGFCLFSMIVSGLILVIKKPRPKNVQ
ncbi:MAG: peptidase [bacterium]